MWHQVFVSAQIIEYFIMFQPCRPLSNCAIHRWQELNLEVFISALPKGVRQVKPDEAAEKPEVKEPKAAKAKKEVVPTPAPEAEVAETKDKKLVKKIKTAKKKVKG